MQGVQSPISCLCHQHGRSLFLSLWPYGKYTLGSFLVAQLVKDPVLSLQQPGQCCGVGSIPGLGTSTCHRHSQIYMMVLRVYVYALFFFFSLLVFWKKKLAWRLLWQVRPYESSKIKVMFSELVTNIQAIQWHISKYICYLWSQSDVIHKRHLRQMITSLLSFLGFTPPPAPPTPLLPHGFLFKAGALVGSSFKGLSSGNWILLCSHWQRAAHA